MSISLPSATSIALSDFFARPLHRSSPVAAKIGPLILLIFGGVLLFGVVWVYFMVPETKGLTLEEVDEM